MMKAQVEEENAQEAPKEEPVQVVEPESKLS